MFESARSFSATATSSRASDLSAFGRVVPAAVLQERLNPFVVGQPHDAATIDGEGAADAAPSRRTARLAAFAANPGIASSSNANTARMK